MELSGQLYPQGKSPLYPLGEPESRSGRGGEEKKNSLLLPGIETRSSSP
jgi:hypothetical protein